MNNSKSKEYFENILHNTEDNIAVYEKKSALLSTLRAISFFVGIALVIVGISDKIFLAGISGVVLLVIFMFLVKHHEKVAEFLELLVCKREAVSNYIARYGEEYKTLKFDGSEYLQKEDTVAYDLDLLGRASVFQLINVCHSDKGKQMLAEGLKGNVISDNIKAINKAVNELSDDIEGAIEFEALAIKGERNKKNKGGKLFFDFCREESLTIPVPARIISVVFPALEIVFITLWIMGVIGYGYAAVLFLLMLGYSELTRGITEKTVAPMLTASAITRDYTALLEQLIAHDYESELLNEIKDNVSGQSGTIHAFKKLNVLSEAYKLAFNPAIYVIMNGMFLWNYRLAELAIKWQRKYGESAANCSDVIARMEYLRSLAVLGIVRDTCYAELSDEMKFSAKEIYHPLIMPERVVSNSTEINSGITIITGSNMSGKTTFLRTIAVNLVLAYIGAPVCGKSLNAGRMKIFTSMRIADDVANGISTFYAEILRIKGMAEYREKNLPMICFVDEIFKGTNSADRIVGATEAIRRLAGENSITLVSTHDFELCNIEDVNGVKAKNYHFEEYYENDVLKFDYTLKQGRCTTTNARAILKMAGFHV